MTAPLRPLPEDGIGALLREKKQLQRAAAGRLAEPLVQATLRTVAHLGRPGLTRPALRSRVWRLVRAVLHELARKHGQASETRMLLQPPSPRTGNGQHGTPQ